MKGGVRVKSTQDVLVRNIPTETLEKIQKQADTNLRSRNNEIIAILMKGGK